VAYVTDVEGRWEKLVDFARDNPDVTLDPAGRLRVRDGAVFVFGGDAIDRGPHGRRVVAALLDAHDRQPDQVVLLAGNRDLNKMRLVRELRGRPHRRAPADLRGPGVEGPLLRWTLKDTMGAGEAFEHRAAELRAEGRAADDDAVVASVLDDLEPDGPLSRYLAACRLAFVEGGTLFVHGAVTAENLGVVPDGAPDDPDPRVWAARLDRFCATQVAAFRERPRAPGGGDPSATDVDPPWQPLIDYQAPLRGTRANQRSVVYGRPVDDQGAPVLPPPAVVARLRAAGISRLVLGHTPSGDCPALLRAPGFTLVLADNAYGRVEPGSQVRIDPDGTIHVRGETLLDSGERVLVRSTLAPDDDSPLGLRDASGRLVKARLERGGYLLFRPLRGLGEVEQLASAPSSPLVVPWPA
jgi:hypothetical protein